MATAQSAQTTQQQVPTAGVPQQTAQPQAGAVANSKNERTIADMVMAKIKGMQESQSISLPADYSPQNAIRSAYLHLVETKDKNGKSALEVCTQTSIANAMLNMVVQGLNPVKKQAYFIVYGDQLQMQRSYFGSVALSKRVAGVKDVRGVVVYEGEEFDWGTDVETGKTVVFAHKPNLDSIDKGKIRAAFAVVLFEDGSKQYEVMTFAQIQKSWNQGYAKGNSGAHQNFSGEMAKKTVINRALKMLINSSTDSSLFADEEAEEAVTVEDATYSEVRHEIAEKASQGPVLSIQQPAAAPPATQPEAKPTATSSSGTSTAAAGAGGNTLFGSEPGF